MALATSVGGHACAKDKPPASAAAEVQGVAPPASDASGAPGCAAPAIAWHFPATGRVVAVGDVHGDLAALRKALVGADVIDEHDRWIAGTATLVQTGDILDRGGDEVEVHQLLAELAAQAKQAGGRILLLNGNHELMNAAGDFRYVTEGGWEDFADHEVPEPLRARLADAPAELRGRIAAFAPGGEWARRLADQPLVAVVGATVFVHGGVLPEHVGHIDEMHRQVQCWLLGHGPPPADAVGGDGPVWTRDYGGDDVRCDRVRAALDGLGARRMVIGHTPQRSGAITSACDGTLWRIDVGMAAFYGGTPAALEIADDVVRARPETKRAP